MEQTCSHREKFFRQKSCIRWLGAEDQNTVVFHKAVYTRTARNTVKRLVNAAGETLTKLSDIKQEAVLHFQRFLQVQDQGNDEDTYPMLQDLLTYRCDIGTATGLVAHVLGEEIKSALHVLPNDKVSGPNGFTKEFFVASWPIIGNDFITAVQSFFLFGFLPTGINATILSLIPKTEEAQSMKDYRPIACCNLNYKVISKVLA